MHSFLGKKLLFVVAHPDDESFTASGTMQKNRLLGGKNYIICATLGEKGRAHLTRPTTEKQLKVIRKRELEQAAKFLKIDGLSFLDLPDTKVNGYGEILAKKVEILIRQIKPDYIFSFGPDGISGHLDHIAVGKAAKKLAAKFKLPFLAFGASPALRKSFDKIKARRKHGKYAAMVTHAIPNIKVKIDAKSKLKALKFHKSQSGQSTMFANMPGSVKKGFVNFEYFISN